MMELGGHHTARRMNLFCGQRYFPGNQSLEVFKGRAICWSIAANLAFDS